MKRINKESLKENRFENLDDVLQLINQYLDDNNYETLLNYLLAGLKVKKDPIFSFYFNFYLGWVSLIQNQPHHLFFEKALNETSKLEYKEIFSLFIKSLLEKDLYNAFDKVVNSIKLLKKIKKQTLEILFFEKIVFRYYNLILDEYLKVLAF